MSCKSETKTIDGVDYVTTQLPAVGALKLLHRVIKVLGPGASKFGDLDQKDINNPANVAVMMTAISEILQRTDEEEFVKLLTDIVQNARADREGNGQFKVIGNINEEYTGEIFTLFKIAAFVIKVNFMSFSEGSVMSKVLENLQGLQGKESQESPTKN